MLSCTNLLGCMNTQGLMQNPKKMKEITYITVKKFYTIVVLVHSNRGAHALKL